VSFSSVSDFLAMGHHGLYVWSAYAIAIAVLALNVLLPLRARKCYLRDQARRLRREQSQ
jgi:heme exporter protein D